MNYEQEREIIKSFAYGMTVEHIAEVEEISIDELKRFHEEHIDEIKKEKEYCEKKGGRLR